LTTAVYSTISTAFYPQGNEGLETVVEFIVKRRMLRGS
jgi:hypothetical protein